MYDYFSNVDYPLQRINTGATSQLNALRKSLVDFKLYIAGDYFAEVPVVTLFSVHKPAGQPLKLTLIVTTNTLLGIAHLEFEDDSYATQEYVRYYFNSDDFTSVASGYSFEGYICFNNLQLMFEPFTSSIHIFTVTPFEPSTVVVLCKQRVHQITCRSALPLLLQTGDNRYTDESAPVLGDVKFVAGDNCTISVVTSTNTVIVGAQEGANDSPNEQCGAWAEKVGPKDILCNEAIYSISGVEPDDNGDVRVLAQSPLVVSAFTQDVLTGLNPDFAPGPTLPDFSHIKRFIYIGLPRSADNPNVFNCD